jgi:hypothetical protein
MSLDEGKDQSGSPGPAYGWLFPALAKDGAAQFEEPEAASRLEAAKSTDDRAGRDVDEALEQIDSEGCRVCPLCGAIVASDWSVLGWSPTGLMASQAFRESVDVDAEVIRDQELIRERP